MGLRIRIAGYEKFWAALIAGNSAQVPINLTLFIMSRINPAYDPGVDILIATIGIFWTSMFAALGTYMATTTTELPQGKKSLQEPV